MIRKINRLLRNVNFFLLGIIASALLLLCSGCTPAYGVTVEEVIEVIQEHGDVWVDSFEQPQYVDGIDILWIIDRSCSMSNDDLKLIDGVEAMMNNMPTSNWRLSMIPMDEDYASDWEVFPLVPGDTVDDAQDMLDDLPQNTSSIEAGFDSTIVYMEDNEYADTWMRPDAGLLIVFVSDEDDQSNEDWDDFAHWLEDQRHAVFVASIVNVRASVNCSPTPSALGTNYEDATNYFNGVLIDICSDDWSQGVKDASNVTELTEVYTLSETPEPDSIKVFVEGQEYSPWVYNEYFNRIEFIVLPDYGTLVEIVYTIEPEQELDA